MIEEHENMIEDVRIKIVAVPDAEMDARREKEADIERRAWARSIFDRANCPARHREQTDLDTTGQWARALERLITKLGSGFIIGLVGERGNGKTQMAVELIRAGSWKGKTALFASATQFFMDVKSAYKSSSGDDERSVLKRYRKPSLLVLDEIGKRGETEWENRLLFELLDKRYGDKSDTLVISNQDPAAFGAALGAALVSRMDESGGIIECGWPSYRRPKP